MAQSPLIVNKNLILVFPSKVRVLQPCLVIKSRCAYRQMQMCVNQYKKGLVRGEMNVDEVRLIVPLIRMS